MKNIKTHFTVACTFLFIMCCMHAVADSSNQWNNPAPTLSQSAQARQNIDSARVNNSNSTSNNLMSDDTYTAISSFEFITVITILIFAIVIFIIYVSLFKSGKLTNYQIVKLIILTLIIIFTSVFITIGYQSSQLAPVVGLFGTIAGYLLGKAPADTDKAQSEK